MPLWDIALTITDDTYVKLNEKKGEVEREGKPFDWVHVTTTTKVFAFKFQLYPNLREVCKLFGEAQEARTVLYWLHDVWDVPRQMLIAVGSQGTGQCLKIPQLGNIKISSLYQFSRCVLFCVKLQLLLRKLILTNI